MPYIGAREYEIPTAQKRLNAKYDIMSGEPDLMGSPLKKRNVKIATMRAKKRPRTLGI